MNGGELICYGTLYVPAVINESYVFSCRCSKHEPCQMHAKLVETSGTSLGERFERHRPYI